MVNGPLAGRFKTDNESLNDFDGLETSFQENGYLFFRQVLDVEQVLESPT